MVVKFGILVYSDDLQKIWYYMITGFGPDVFIVLSHHYIYIGASWNALPLGIVAARTKVE